MTPVRATHALFFLSSFVLTAWGPLVPLAKARLALDEGGMGLLILAIGIGGVLAMPAAGGLSARFGYRRVIGAAMALALIILPALAWLSGFAALWAALFLFGAGMGFTDVAMNIHAARVEQIEGRPLMSGFHGMWSVGAVAGSGLTSLLLGLGLAPGRAALLIALAGAAGLAGAVPGLMPGAPRGQGGPAFALPRGAVVLLGGLCFIVYLTEHSVLDWSAIYLTGRGADVATAGLGSTLFASAMTLMRFAGDRIRLALGDRRTVQWSALVGGAGLAVVIGSGSVAFNLLGYAILGGGVANVVPILFSAAGRSTVMPPNLAVAAVGTLSQSGLLVGPALIGLVANATSLSWAFALLVAGLLVVALASGAAVGEPATAPRPAA